MGKNNMEFRNCSSLPIALAGLIISAACLCYVTSVGLGHVYYFLPFLSDIYSFPPESCLYSLIANPGALIMNICFWIRNEQVERHVTSSCYPIRSVLIAANRLNKWFSLTAVIGFVIITHFQESNTILFHLNAGIVFFVAVAFYAAVDAFITYNTTLSTRPMAKFKLGLVIVASVIGITILPSIGLLYLWFKGDKLEDILLIKPEDDGYIFHTVAAISEWITILSFIVYLAMQSKEFQGLSIKLPEVRSVITVSPIRMKDDETAASESDISRRAPHNSVTSMENQTSADIKYKLL